MFLGHFSVGLGAKTAAPRVSLGTLFLAAQFVDLLWPTLLLLGIEHVEVVPGITRVTPLDFVDYPITHSLIAVCGWGILFSLGFWLLRRQRTAAIVVGACVISHWLLDLLVHRPDLPVWPGGPVVGLGLWNSLTGTLVVEGVLFGAGTFLYQRCTRANNRAGRYGFWGLIVFLGLIYVANLTGPPPPDATAIAWVGQAQWLLILWGYWVDKNRSPRQHTTEPNPDDS